MMELLPGTHATSPMTFDCDRSPCMYHQSGRCIYNIACIKVRMSRACYEELRQDEIEAELDRLDAGG